MYTLLPQLPLTKERVQADAYSNGVSEEIIGKAIQQYDIPRERLVILSKCYFGVSSDGSQPRIAQMSTNDGPGLVNQVGLSRKHILDAVDNSVKRLGTYIDLLQIHRLDRDTPMKEIMRTLNDVIESGKVRYIGASSMAAWEVQMLQNIAETNGWYVIVFQKSELDTRILTDDTRQAQIHFDAKPSQLDLPRVRFLMLICSLKS